MYKVQRIQKIVINRYPCVFLNITDNGKIEEIERSYGIPRRKIITDPQFIKYYQSCFFQAAMELEGYFVQELNSLMSFMDRFSHTIKFTGRSIYIKIEDSNYEEIYNPKKKSLLRKNNKLLISDLQLKLDRERDFTPVGDLDE